LSGHIRPVKQRDMAPDDDRLMSLVDLALAKPPGEREAYLRRECAGDSQLFERANDYVQWEERMGGFLLEPFCSLELLDPAFEPEELIEGRFRIVAEAGEGGMAIVYRAEDEKLHKTIAIKCAKEGFRTRLTPEVVSATRIAHDNVCKIFEIHTAATDRGELDFITMEFLEGPTLTERLRGGPLPEREARAIARQLFAGLAAAHRSQVIHGDLKSNNVILTQAGDGSLRAVITDFGLARGIQPLSGNAPPGGSGGAVGGAPDYMAPELWEGEKASVASDIYAMGVICYEMLSGTRVHEPGAPGQKRRVRKSPRVHPKWDAILARCLDPDPARRYRSVEEIGEALAPKSHLWMLAAAGVVLAAAITGVVTYQRMTTPPETVRLAVLPFSVEGDGLDTAAGIGLEVADRLSGARRRFSVISPREVEQNQAVTPEQARKTLGATHALETQVRALGGQISATASLVDLQSGRTVGQLSGTYPAGDSGALAKALAATVTKAFRLPAVNETVQGAAYPYYVRGVDLLRQDNAKNADQAIPLFTKAMEMDPRSALPYAGLAEAQIQMFDRGDGAQWLDLAEATVAKAKSINADSVPVLLTSGFVEQQHGRYEQAIREFTRATELAPGDAEPWRRLAQCYADSNQADEAIATYRKAIEAQPNYYRNYLTFGTFYFNRGQYERAEEQYRRAIAVAPGLATGHMDLGLALMQEGRFPEAESQLLEALRARESNRLLMNLGGVYYEEERFAEAAKYFEKSVAGGAPTAMLYRDLGDAYRHLGKAREAAATYRRGQALAEEEITRNPRRANWHALSGLLAAFLGDQPRAHFELSQALALEPENRSVMRDAAIAYETLRKRKEALGALRNAPKRLLEELSRQPDVKDLQKDAQFQAILRGKRTE
jgi:tetratricopeptide (TPR) repeat protein/TolB-like protein